MWLHWQWAIKGLLGICISTWLKRGEEKKKNAVNEMTKDGKYCVSTYKWLDIWLKHANSLTLIIITHLIELEKSPPEMQFRSFAFIPNPISKLNGILPWIYPGSDADIPVPPMHFSISAATGIHWPSIVISMSPKKGNCVRAQAFHGCGITTPHLFPRIFRKIRNSLHNINTCSIRKN